MSCPLNRNTVKNGLVESATQQLDASGLFDRLNLPDSRSGITNDNTISIDPQYPKYEQFPINVFDEGTKVGVMNMRRVGPYLEAFKVDIAGLQPNTGTYAHMQAADFARDQGLQLRSDSIPTRMSEGSIRLWERFVEAGQAEKQGDHYIFTGTADAVGDYFEQKGIPVYQPKDINSDHLQVVKDINNGFGGEVIYKVADNNQYKVSPSQAIIDKYFNSTLRGNEFEGREFTNKYDKTAIREELGLDDNSTPQDFIDKSMQQHATQIANMRKSNPNLAVEFGEEDSQFDPQSNKVFINLEEMKDISDRMNLPLSQVVSTFMLHEMAHGALYYGIETGKNDQVFKELYDIALAQHKINPFDDQLRGGYNSNGLPYSFKDIHEFTADANSNPYFQEWLKSIPYEGSKNLWQKILDTILEFFGFQSRPNLYDKIIEFSYSDKISEDNRNGADRPSAEWPMELIIKNGMPKNYSQSAAFELFTNDLIKDEISDIVRKIPSSMVKIKKAINDETNKEKVKSLQRLLDAYTDVQGQEESLKVSINMLTQAAVIAKDIREQLAQVPKLDTDIEKIMVADSGLRMAQSLEFIAPLATDIINLVTREGLESARTRAFITQLNGIISVSSTATRTYNNVIEPAVLNILTADAGISDKAREIQASIEDLEKRLQSASGVKAEILKKAIKLERESLRLIPSGGTLRDIFAGNYVDASASQLYFEAPMAVGHPLAALVAKRVRENDQQISMKMNAIKNKHATELDKLKKAIGMKEVQDIDSFFKKIYTTAKRVSSVEVDENGDIQYKYTEQKMFLSQYSPEYVQKVSEMKALENYYFVESERAHREGKDDLSNDLAAKYQDAYKARKAFYRENSESKYSEEVNQMYDLLDQELQKPITNADGTTTMVTTTFLKERGNIFSRIEDLETRRDSYEITLEGQEKLQEEIEQTYIELKEIRSQYNPDGSEKEGFEKELADIANKYSELKNQYGTYQLTDAGKASFEREVQTLEKRLSEGSITQEMFDTRMSDIIITEVDEKYYEALKAFDEKILDLTEKISKIPEFSKMFQGVDREKIRQGYAKLRELVKPFRDNEQTINGPLISRLRPEVVKQIKAIQQESENLTAVAQKLKGLSIEEQVRLNYLSKARKKGTLQEGEMAELDALIIKSKEGRDLYEKYKDTLDEYAKLQAQKSELNESYTSMYYVDEVDHQRSIVIRDRTAKVLEEARTATTLENGAYEKLPSGWARLLRDEAGKKVYEKVPLEGFKTSDEAVAHMIANFHADEDLRQSDWWKENHYQKYIFDKEEGTFTQQDAPLYIWVKTEPADKSFIKDRQPSIRFKTYKINDDQVNQNYKTINDGIPIAKAGKFVNDNYTKLKTSTEPKDQAYFNYLEFLRSEHNALNDRISGSKKFLGDFLPSFPKTHNEHLYETFRGLKQKASNLIAVGVKKTDNPDEQITLGASTTDFYAKNKIIPLRFTNMMDAEKQSSDMAAMTLAYTLSVERYEKNVEDQPLFEAIRSLVQNMEVQEVKSLTTKFSIKNFIGLNKTERQQKTVQKEGAASNLSKTINNLFDTQVYEHTKEDAYATLGNFTIDLNKVSSNLKRFSSLSIFAFNSYSAIKNSLSAYIQGNINGNISKGFFTRRQYNKGHSEAIMYAKDFISDYTKLGNKTKIGQELDFFQVLHGEAYNHYGEKTSWTRIKDSGSALTILKNISEFELQVAQYLAMSKANPVKVKGVEVEFRKAFEINKEGNLAPVEGAEITEKDITNFMNKLAFANRIINGAYRAEEKNALQKNIIGDLAFYLNGYMIPSIVNRFGKTRYSIEGDIITKGYHSQMLSLLKDLVRFRGNLSTRWSTMNVDEKNRVFRSLTEIGVILGMLCITLALGAGDDKKELKKNSALKNWALAMAMGVKSETETFIPLPGMGLNEMARKMNSPFAALRQISNLVKVLQNLSLLAIGSDDAYYKQTSVKDGFHDKGDPKAIANLLRLIGYSGVGFDSVEKVLQVEKSQTLR